MNFLAAGLFLIASGLLMRWLDRVCSRAPMHELMRYPGTDAAIANYERRRDALGLGAARNVRELEEA